MASLDTDSARTDSLRGGSLRKIAGSPLRGSATGASSDDYRRRSYLCCCPAFYFRRWQLCIGNGSRARSFTRTSTFLHAAFYAGPAHAAKLHARLIHMAAPCALCASGLVAPSLRLPPFQPHTARAAKLIFRTILSPAESTKHEDPLNSFERRLTHLS